MKKTLLALAVIASASAFASTSALATEISKGRVISHKEWTTGNVKATVLKQVTPQAMALKLKSFHKARSTSLNFVASIMDPVTSHAAVGTPTEVSGTSYVLLENDTGETKLYGVSSRVCAVDDPFMHCTYYYDEVELESGGTFKHAVNPVLTVTFSQPGSHDIATITDVTAGLDSGKEQLTLSESLSTVEVAGRK